jgi:rRNA processing protein Gar1
VIDKVELHHIADVFGDIRKVFLIVLRDDDFVDAVTMGGKQLLFQAADGQNLSA